MFYPWYTRMRRAGLTGNNGREILKEALLINSGEALEAAILGCLNAVSQNLKNRGLAAMRRDLVLHVWQSEELQAARLRLKQIMHEAC